MANPTPPTTTPTVEDLAYRIVMHVLTETETVGTLAAQVAALLRDREAALQAACQGCKRCGVARAAEQIDSLPPPS